MFFFLVYWQIISLLLAACSLSWGARSYLATLCHANPLLDDLSILTQIVLSLAQYCIISKFSSLVPYPFTDLQTFGNSASRVIALSLLAHDWAWVLGSACARHSFASFIWAALLVGEGSFKSELFTWTHFSIIYIFTYIPRSKFSILGPYIQYYTV